MSSKIPVFPYSPTIDIGKHANVDDQFSQPEIEELNKEQLKNFIKERANQKLIELGYQSIYNDIDPSLLKQMEWFGHLTSGVEHQDFFAGRVTTYAKSTSDWSDL